MRGLLSTRVDLQRLLLREPGAALIADGATSVAQLPLGTANDLASASGISLVRLQLGAGVGAAPHCLARMGAGTAASRRQPPCACR